MSQLYSLPRINLLPIGQTHREARGQGAQKMLAAQISLSGQSMARVEDDSGGVEVEYSATNEKFISLYCYCLECESI